MKADETPAEQELDSGWDEEPAASGSVPPRAAAPESVPVDSSGLDDLWDAIESVPVAAGSPAAQRIAKLEATAAKFESPASWTPIPPAAEPPLRSAPRAAPNPPAALKAVPVQARAAQRSLSKKERRELERKQRALATQRQTERKRERRREREQERIERQEAERAKQAERDAIVKQQLAARALERAAEPRPKRAAAAPARTAPKKAARVATTPPAAVASRKGAQTAPLSRTAKLSSQVPWFAVALVVFSLVAVWLLMRR